ncbi:MAG: glycosyltransferase family 2 protein [Bacteroidaceae bacterium]|jgi:glycosyltransferase involved in cell wall biosynthesis
MSAPVFSIITVTYNAERTLPATLASILAQKYQHIEFILIDGNSKDRTFALAQELEPQLREHCTAGVKLQSEPDKGLYDAMNKGLHQATGDYLIFLNAGDRFHSVQTLREAADQVMEESPRPDLLYGQTNIVDATGKYLRPRHYRAPDTLTSHSFLQGMLVCHQAFWPSRPLCEGKVGNLRKKAEGQWIDYDLQYRYSADYDWCIRLLSFSRYNYYTRDTLIDYLDEGLTTQNHRASLRERFRIMAKHYGRGAAIASHLRIVLRRIFH